MATYSSLSTAEFSVSRTIIRSFWRTDEGFTGEPFHIGYAESRDGKTFVKPRLGLYEFCGSKDNNIVWEAPSLDNFHVFRDTNPDRKSTRLNSSHRT